jgi:AGZA family xanthine/uracil permease-like MFS transporter
MILSREIIGGLTTFVTMAYIVVVNPAILSTLLMGLYARLPFAVAPGMGLNAFFAYTIVLREGVPWQTAFGVVFWAGVLFLLVSITPVREHIARAIPRGLRLSAAAGIGLLLTFIGLRNAGIIEGDPVTLVRLGTLDHRVVLLVVGLAVAVVLMRRDHPLAFLAAIGVVTILAWGAGYAEAPARLFAPPDFGSTFLRLDLAAALQWTLLPAMVTIMFTDLFDSLSTFMGVASAAGLTDDEGQPINLRKGLLVDACATLGAGLAGTSPGTAYIESISGIRMGGRTGLASVVTAACFLPCFFVAPLVAAIPTYATASVLVLVGVAMFQTIGGIDFSRVEEGLPAFVTLTMIPLTFSITQGILWGFILHALLFTVSGRRREVKPALWALAAISVVLLVIETR